jgi:hypothetical protein
MAVGLLSAASREAATLSMARTLAANAAFVLSLSKDGGSPYVAMVRQAHHWVGGLADRSAPTAASTTLFNLLGGLRPARKLPLHCVPPHIVGEPFGIGAKLRAKLKAW